MDTSMVEKIRSRAMRGDARSQFLMSQVCLQQRRFEEMHEWLARADQAGVPEALDALAHAHQYGLGIERDFAGAFALYDRAITAGVPQACYRKAELLYKSRDAHRHAGEISRLLVDAATHNYLPALKVLGYLALEHGENEVAVEALRRAAFGGDPASAFNLGWFILDRGGGDGLAARSKFWLERAAGAQYPYASALLGELRNVAATVPPQPSGDVPVPGPAGIFPPSANRPGRRLDESLDVTVYGGVLGIIDCAYLINLARPFLRRASVIDPEGTREGQVSDVRTNLSTYLPFEVVDFIGRYIELKIVAATGEKLECSEPMSILCYERGQFYEPHVDYFDPDLPVSAELMEDGGQRTASAITYLAAPAAGGGTSFPELDLTVAAETGSTLWFRNANADGEIEKRSLHAGDPVEQGEKWVVTKWFRERETSYLVL